MPSEENQIPVSDLNPRKFADKSVPEALQNAIRFALEYEREMVRQNTQTFNRNRYLATAEMDDYESLKDRVRRIKEEAIESLPRLLEQLKHVVTRRGGHFYLAQTAADAREYISRVCREEQARLVVKSKSMTTEELRLNPALEEDGVEVVETDLGEMIIQLAGEHPAHLVGPAIHRSQKSIAALFKRVFDTDEPLDSGEALTKFGRDRLREKFLQADVGITGANLIAADTGSLLLVESEGNIRAVMQAPPVHIAVAGVEKVISSRQDFPWFMELLAASGTGQPLTTYTSVISPPLEVPPFAFRGKEKKERQFHLVLIDNGRLEMRNDPQLRQALYCIRCGACLNACANFQTLGGHAFGGETYSGGIGGAWEAGTKGEEKAAFSELCTGCSRCVPQCPVRINIPWLNTVLRDRLNHRKDGLVFPFPDRTLFPGDGPDKSISAQKRFFGNYHRLAKWGAGFAPVSNWAGRVPGARWLLERWVGLDRRRVLPAFTRRTLRKQYHRWQTVRKTSGNPGKYTPNRPKAVLFADTYTNYLHPAWGMAALRVLTSLGIEAGVCETLPAGRAALSQGMITTAAGRARKTAASLGRFLAAGRDILVVEPSVLALFRTGYEQFLEAWDAERLANHSYDPVEYLEKIMAQEGLAWDEYFDRDRIRREVPPLFFHRHCQQRTIGTDAPVRRVLEHLGFQVSVSDVECCGMAGSFGYTKEYYEVSKAVGEDLFAQIRHVEAGVAGGILVAGGTSCHSQIQEGTGREAVHPMVLLERYLKK